jgi:hypothetical protein
MSEAQLIIAGGEVYESYWRHLKLVFFSFT